MKLPNLDDAKRLFPLPLLMRQLGVPAESISERDGVLVPCPWHTRHKHGDRRPSFNLHRGQTRYRCFGCGAAGDVVDFLADWCQLDSKEAIQRFREMAGGGEDAPAPIHKPPSPRAVPLETELWGDTAEKRAKRQKWPFLRRGDDTELESVATLRGLAASAIWEADRRGSLRFTELGGRHCWVLVSDCGRIAQARRLDGLMWERNGHEFKSWSLSGSCAAVPLGLDSLRGNGHPVAIAEGGPDWLAVLQLALEQGREDVGIIGFLGSSMKIAPPLLERLKNSSVRIMAHADEAGHRAAAEWAEQLSGAGCEVDAMDFAAFDCKDANEFIQRPLEQREVEVFP